MLKHTNHSNILKHTNWLTSQTSHHVHASTDQWKLSAINPFTQLTCTQLANPPPSHPYRFHKLVKIQCKLTLNLSHGICSWCKHRCCDDIWIEVHNVHIGGTSCCLTGANNVRHALKIKKATSTTTLKPQEIQRKNGYWTQNSFS